MRAMTRGFDAIVGNPPWVSYAGKAAQPIADRRRAWYDAFYASFAGYKNLQGLFLERIASVGHTDARLGVVLPSSMAELKGYAPTRAAFDRAVVSDPSLPDLGEAASAASRSLRCAPRHLPRGAPSRGLRRPVAHRAARRRRRGDAHPRASRGTALSARDLRRARLADAAR